MDNLDNTLKKIHEDIERVKVIDVKELEVIGNSNFVELKKGEYTLNNRNTIVRESIHKKLGTGNAVCIFAVTIDKKILVVIQSRVALPDKDKVNMELPAGYVEMGEDIIEAGMRELLEETGYATEDIFKVDEYYPSLGFSGEKITLLLALNCMKVAEQHLDKDEFLHYEVVTLKEFEYLLNQGYLKDANTRIGYYRYLEYLMKEGY